jgi:hypothetical protein
MLASLPQADLEVAAAAAAADTTGTHHQEDGLSSCIFSFKRTQVVAVVAMVWIPLSLLSCVQPPSCCTEPRLTEALYILYVHTRY